ncbi:MAG: hypothetical protein GC138_03185 [Gammaproteobacteria bacterium]|nr:hypothetical protein [Gammaproteobacteria bacterium]
MSHRFIRVSMRLLGLLFFCLSSVVHASTDGWISATPLPADVVINDMDCRPDGLCVAVGLGGSILTSSTNGVTWVRQDSHTMHRLYDITYAGPTQGFWVVGEGGVIMHGSNDGLSWTHVDSGSRKALFSIAYGKFGSGAEILVAVGQQGVILVSQDLGVTWARPDNANLPGIYPSFGAVGFFTDRFIAVGSSAAILQSFDGLTWSEVFDDLGQRLYAPTTGADLNEVTVGNVTGVGTRYVAIGEGGVVLTSDDGGTRWTTRVPKTTADQELLAITWDGVQFIAVGVGGRMATSTDGVAWIDQTALNNVNWNLVEVHWDPTSRKYFVAGNSAASGSYTGGFIKISPSADSLQGVWTTVTSGPTNPIVNGVTALDSAHGNVFVAVGTGGLILLSSDGNAWTGPASVPAGITASSLNAVAAAGASVFAVSDTGQIYASADSAQNWTGPIAPTSNALNAVTTNGSGTYVAVGDAGTVEISTDGGVTWGAAASVPMTGINLTGVAWSPTLNLYVATGVSLLSTTIKGALWSSSDGQTWTAVATPAAITAALPDNDLYAIAWINNRFVAVGKYGMILYSSDGVTWTGGPATEIPGSLYGVAWDGTNIVVVGTVSGGITPTTSGPVTAIFMSHDNGATWAGHEKLGAETLYSVAWNGTTYTAGGQSGLLYTSGGLDAAINPLLNASVDTAGSTCDTTYINGLINLTLSPPPIPTCVPTSYFTNYQLTVTNNGNIDVPANSVKVAINFGAGAEFIWNGATMTVDRTTTAISCDTTDALHPVCTVPVSLNVFPLPTGQTATNRPKEGVDIAITIQPTTVSTISVDFEALTPGVTLTDQNSVNNTLRAQTTVLKRPEILCSPDLFLNACGSIGGSGVYGWWSLALLLLGGGLRRFSASARG